MQVSPKSSGHDAGSGVNQSASGSGSGGRGSGATGRGGRQRAAGKAEVRSSSRTDRQSSAEEPADEVR